MPRITPPVQPLPLFRPPFSLRIANLQIGSFSFAVAHDPQFPVNPFDHTLRNAVRQMKRYMLNRFVTLKMRQISPAMPPGNAPIPLPGNAILQNGVFLILAVALLPHHAPTRQSEISVPMNLPLIAAR